MTRFALAPDADSSALAGALDAIEAAARADGLRAGTVDRVVLVAGELLSNAIEHGTGSVTGEWEATPSGGRLVLSGGCQPETGWIEDAVLPGTGSTGGRGLFIVRELADNFEDIQGGLVVSFVNRLTE